MRTIAVCTALLFAGIATADEVPVVKTRFVITGPKFTAGLGGQRENAQRTIGADIASMLKEENYPFFDWREDSESGGQTALLVVILREHPLDNTRSEFFLDYHRVIKGVERSEVDLKFGSARQLYGVGSRSQPYRDPTGLRNDVIKRVKDDLRSYRDEFQAQFISKISLGACKPKVDKNHTIVLDGISWDAIQATKSSILLVGVIVRKLATDPPTDDFITTGSLQLTQLEQAGEAIGGHLGYVRCATVDTNVWLTGITAALDEQRIEKALLYVEHYEFESHERAQSPD